MTPSEFYLPPEWVPQKALWLSWPSNPKLWAGCFEKIPPFFAEYAAAVSRFEPVRINAAGALHPEIGRLARAAGADMARVELYDHPTNDVWCRDHGPLFLKNEQTGEVAVSDWRFNAWGEKFEPYDLDDAVPGRIAHSLGMRRFVHSDILEGGGIEINENRQLLTTRSVIFNPNRGWPAQANAERILREGLGANEIFWLNDGLEGDDTDGHIDNLARFAPGGVIVAATAPKNSPNFAALDENWRLLESFRTAGGKPFSLVEMPLPEKPVLAPDGRVLPASYVNYLVINGAVLFPAYNQPSDMRAQAILRDVFPGREVLGIDCTAVLAEGGALHCLSQQEPA